MSIAILLEPMISVAVSRWNCQKYVFWFQKLRESLPEPRIFRFACGGTDLVNNNGPLPPIFLQRRILKGIKVLRINTYRSIDS